MDRKDLSTAEIVRFWYAKYEGRIPKGRNKEQLRAMRGLIQEMENSGITVDDIKSNYTASLVEKAAVHQGPTNERFTKAKKESWIHKVKDDWDVAVRSYILEKEAMAKAVRDSSPVEEIRVPLQLVIPPEEDIDELAKNVKVGPERKVQPIRPEEMLNTDTLDIDVEENTLINNELEEFVKKHGG
jgi:hypothetical protein